MFHPFHLYRLQVTSLLAKKSILWPREQKKATSLMDKEASEQMISKEPNLSTMDTTCHKIRLQVHLQATKK